MKRRRTVPLSSAQTNGANSSARLSVPLHALDGVTPTPAAVRNRIVRRAMMVAAERSATSPLDNDCLEKDAAKWLSRLAKSKHFLAPPKRP